MVIKLEINEPGPFDLASSEIQTTTLVTELVDKKPVVAIRANAMQLGILNASFAMSDSPNKTELDGISRETGLYVCFILASVIRRESSDGCIMCFQIAW
jgi:Na+-transporting NADH:ubiquinone oxidoreductase subunit NqrD